MLPPLSHWYRYYSTIEYGSKVFLSGYLHFFVDNKNVENVESVDNFYLRRFSPMFTTSPAPIVINKSPWITLSRTKFSMASKLGR